MIGDWEFETESGDVYLGVLYNYEWTLWSWVPKVRVPFKANKHRYGR